VLQSAPQTTATIAAMVCHVWFRCQSLWIARKDHHQGAV